MKRHFMHLEIGDLYMKLDLQQIKSITTGAVSVVQEAEGVQFYRFTQEQLAAYEKRSETFFKKSKTTSGVKLRFRTDSGNLFLRFLVNDHIGASFMAFDVFVDGKMIGSLNNFEGLELPRRYMKLEFPIGEFSGSFNLGRGEKEVTVHLPWNAFPYLQEITLDDGATLVPVKPNRKLLALGDSITYGNASMHPSSRYIARLSDALGAEEFNKGIGGEFFWPELPSLRDAFVPDYIVVAYGTNDWRKHPREAFFADVKGFFDALNEAYPDVKTIVITPIWRSNLNAETDFSSMEEVSNAIRKAASSRPDTVLVEGFSLVPHDVSYFADYGCHPNDEGFAQYFENLWKQIRDKI